MTGHQSAAPASEVRRVLEVQDGVRMTEREVVGGGHVPDEVRSEPDEQRGNHRHVTRRASCGGSESTSNAGAHSATVTFWRKCAVRR